MDCPIHRWSLETPNAPALIFEGTVLTFSALAARTGAWEDALRRHGVHPGGRVALLSTNHPDLVCIMLATLRLHATCVPLNARLMPPELATLLQLIRPELTLAHPALKERVPGALCFADPVLTPGMPSQTWLDDDAVAFILFTSGTTGTPKGAQLSVANLQASANANAENLGPSNQQQRWLASLPLCHVGGLAMMWRCLVGGGVMVLQPRFDAELAVRALQDQQITHASLVPTTLLRLMDGAVTQRFPLLQAVLIGGGPVDGGVLTRARSHGIPVLWTYGLTEACSQVATQRLAEADGSPHGRAVAGTTVRIVDDDRRAVAAGVVGEIEVRGPTVMRGYDSHPDASAAALTPDGWLRTQDLGVLDSHGRLQVLARRTDLIIRGGENVYPAEVESVLLSHDAVADAAVVAREDVELGQRVEAVVVLRYPIPPGLLVTWVRTRLASFKVPAAVHVVKELPRNALGKLDRRGAAALLQIGV